MVSGPASGSREERQVFPHEDDHSSPTSTAPHRHSTTSPLITRLQLLSTKIPEYYVAPFSGACAGVASGIVTCPLDVIKTKLQAQGGFTRRGGNVPAKVLYRGMIGTGKVIWREEGIRGLYQGLAPMLLGYLPTWGVYLSVYDSSREFYYDKTGQYRLFEKYKIEETIIDYSL